ncbi:hypothetical protein DC083_04915 [Ignatzschineria ureiclastica]|uniref:DUF1887 domain-containing protein n=1 Tax=Ignatzschineria ureiclastica TaxID=472582 RepID=A0A2U2AF07_9GAMM|nr:DUF1887 family CARF protein [Ignatzschineria ureiclastica]PWD81233.1 hypothetical protein DC083_04915 [Ignatzschineria ureiclastica]GGZ97338.1 hypothetical protein GCM10007162_11870 [Ignatzschineria ureiclastica]
MKKYQVQICTISNELTPNYIPVIHEQFMPKELVLLASSDMDKKANDFIQVLKKNHPHTVIHTITIDDIYNLADLKSKVNSYIENYLEAHPDEEKGIVLNATGGTKLMSFELLSLFNSWGLDTFYFKIENSEVFFLQQPESSDSEKISLILHPKKIDLASYVQLHNHQIISTQKYTTSALKKALFEELIRFPDLYRPELSQLYYEIGRSSESLLTVPLVTPQLKVLDQFVAAKICRLEGKNLIFPSMEDKKFLMGGWFEDYVYSLVDQLADIQALELNIQIKSAEDNVHKPNELDVGFMRYNRLYLVECKTANYGGEARKQGVADLNKLKTLDTLGGRSTQLAFVSYFKVSPDMRDRAKGNHIYIIDGNDVQGLKKLLDKWSQDE